MVWDCAEVNPFSGQTGDFSSANEWILGNLESFDQSGSPLAVEVCRRDARQQPEDAVSLVVTDPPYYDAINYADVSDFFYVWLKRSIGSVHPEHLLLPLTPKKEQIVMNIYADGEGKTDRREAAKEKYIRGMADAFKAMRASLEVQMELSGLYLRTPTLTPGGPSSMASWTLSSSRTRPGR